VKAAFPVFLIDLDGVLVEPRGYRLAIQSTLAWFTEKIGLGDLYPGEDAIARFEAINMTCEWDITPIILASIFDGLSRENPQVTLPGGLQEACKTVRALSLKAPRLELTRMLTNLAAHFKPGMEYASLALELSRPGVEDPLYPHLVGHPLLTSILAGTRDLEGALTTRVFQHFTLGSERYQKLCGLAPFFESESYLQKYDKVLLDNKCRESLLSIWQKEKLGLVVYTARPSLPEKGGVLSFNYSPEAEVALEALGLDQVPLVGAGKMGWLALQLGKGVNQLTKPSPVQALAAITTAVTRQTGSALWAAARLTFENEKSDYRNFPPLSIHVFEDAGGNINAVRLAADILTNAGVQNRVTAWGIGENPEKQKALTAAGAVLVPEINQAVQQAFELEGLNN
jgi:hypothetical protein